MNVSKLSGPTFRIILVIKISDLCLESVYNSEETQCNYFDKDSPPEFKDIKHNSKVWYCLQEVSCQSISEPLAPLGL